MGIIKGLLTGELKKIIYDGFEAHAISSIGVSEIEDSVAFYIENDKKEVISAVVAQSFWGNLHIKYVWTHKNHRSKGYASKLMNEALNFAVAKNHNFAYVETMSFQAPEFYKKFGFRVEFIRHGYSRNISFYYMKKDL